MLMTFRGLIQVLICKPLNYIESKLHFIDVCRLVKSIRPKESKKEKEPKAKINTAEILNNRRMSSYLEKKHCSNIN